MIKETVEFLSERHQVKQAQRAERRRLEAERREAERQRQAAERQAMLARLTERYRKQFGWEMTVTDAGRDDWGDLVLELDDGAYYVAISQRDPTIYKKKAKEEPAFKLDLSGFQRRRELEELRDEILEEIREEKAASDGQPA